MRQLSFLVTFALALPVQAQPATQVPPPPSPQVSTTPASVPAGAANGGQAANESALGELLVTGVSQENLPKIAILPSLSPDLEDVVVRGVVRRDFELTGLFDVLPDSSAPSGFYGFSDPVDIDAWRKLGAEAIVKVAARSQGSGKVQVFGIAYFLNVGREPVYEKTLVVDKLEVRVTAHRMTDALLGALTGRPGGFASQFTFSGKWGKNRRIFRMDSDGNALVPLTGPNDLAISPTFARDGRIIYAISQNYSPFRLLSWSHGSHQPVRVPFSTSIYGATFSKDASRLALAVSENGRSSIYVGNPDGSDLKRVSNNELATRPVFSPTGKLAWVGGQAAQGSQRIYLDGKAISPSGFSAASPTFCETEDGVRLVYAVAVGGDRTDLVMADDKGKVLARLTQNQGSNSYPACSPDGRLLAFFSTRGKGGIFMMSLKSLRTQQISSQMGESLTWAALPASGIAVPSAPGSAPNASARP